MILYNINIYLIILALIKFAYKICILLLRGRLSEPMINNIAIVAKNDERLIYIYYIYSI